MAIVYFDSSAFLKLLVEEDGSELAATLWDGCDAAVSSRLAYPEVCAALAAAGRSDRLSSGDQRRAEAEWEDYWACDQTGRAHRAGHRARRTTGRRPRAPWRRRDPSGQPVRRLGHRDGVRRLGSASAGRRTDRRRSSRPGRLSHTAGQRSAATVRPSRGRRGPVEPGHDDGADHPAARRRPRLRPGPDARRVQGRRARDGRSLLRVRVVRRARGNRVRARTTTTPTKRSSWSPRERCGSSSASPGSRHPPAPSCASRPGVTHDFENRGEAPATAFNLFMPGGFEAPFRAWYEADRAASRAAIERRGR